MGGPLWTRGEKVTERNKTITYIFATKSRDLRQWVTRLRKRGKVDTCNKRLFLRFLLFISNSHCFFLLDLWAASPQETRSMERETVLSLQNAFARVSLVKERKKER